MANLMIGPKAGTKALQHLNQPKAGAANRYGFVTPELRANFQEVAASKDMQGLLKALTKVLPSGTISGTEGTRASITIKEGQFFHVDLFGQRDSYPLKFNVQSSKAAEVNTIRELEVGPGSVRILLKRGPEGRRYDGGFTYQQLTLELAPDGRVKALEGTTGRTLTFTSLWNSRKVVIPEGATVTSWTDGKNGTRGAPFPTSKL